jgi:hypothetical protein
MFGGDCIHEYCLTRSKQIDIGQWTSERSLLNSNICTLEICFKYSGDEMIESTILTFLHVNLLFFVVLTYSII